MESKIGDFVIERDYSKYKLVVVLTCFRTYMDLQNTHNYIFSC